MFAFFVFAILLSISTDVVQSKYEFKPDINGWIKTHKVMANWNTAQQKCQSEGAVLMSPTTPGLLKEMKSLISFYANEISPYYIGIRAESYEDPFLSIEGVDVDDMPVAEMYVRLDPYGGGCLVMNDVQISPTPCDTISPYMCYINKTDCGSGYKHYELTNKCYKLHRDRKNWNDAQSTCSNENGHLIIINDLNEANIVVNMSIVNDSPYTYVGVRCYAGEDGNCTWKSLEGNRTEHLYNNWFSKENIGDDRCAIIQTDGKLVDDSCHHDREFICEKHPDTSRYPS